MAALDRVYAAAGAGGELFLSVAELHRRPRRLYWPPVQLVSTARPGPIYSPNSRPSADKNRLISPGSAGRDREAADGRGEREL